MYGGTKTEMQRLIKDASQLKDVQKELGVTVDANSMSFANIVNAISVTQKHMGIMGTTAKEASETIQGSVNSMKASWQNLLTGIADDNANFDKLFNEFIDSVEIAFKNLLPRIEIILKGIIQLIINIASNQEIIQGILNMVTTFIQTMITCLMDNLPSILESLTTILQTLIELFMENLPLITGAVIKILFAIVEAIIQNLPMIVDAGMKCTISLMERNYCRITNVN